MAILGHAPQPPGVAALDPNAEVIELPEGTALKRSFGVAGRRPNDPSRSHALKAGTSTVRQQLAVFPQVAQA